METEIGATWLKLGDKNTKYFHAITNGMKKVNSIIGLQSNQGQQIGDNEINGHIYHHFEALLSHQVSHDIPFNLLGKVGPAFPDLLQTMDTKIMEQEIHMAIKEMPKGNASGPDVMPIKFYKTFWEQSKEI